MQVAILGAGAIGCLLGAYLHEGGQSILLVHHRKEVVESIRRNGVVVRDPLRRRIRARLEIVQSLSQGDHPDLILITVKAYDTENVVRHLGHLFRTGVPILSVQNGFGNIETISQFVSRSSILAGTTTEAAILNNPGFVSHVGRGRTWIGELDGKTTNRLKHVRTMFEIAGLRTAMSSNIEGVIWSKAIVNSAINPISAIERVLNGNIIENHRLLSIASRIVREGTGVAIASRIKLSPKPSRLLHTILKTSSKNKSSMLRDIELGKKTEIMQLNGWIVRTARTPGIETPYNAYLTHLVLGLNNS